MEITSCLRKKRLSCWLHIEAISRQREISVKYICRTQDAIIDFHLPRVLSIKLI